MTAQTKRNLMNLTMHSTQRDADAPVTSARRDHRDPPRQRLICAGGAANPSMFRPVQALRPPRADESIVAPPLPIYIGACEKPPSASRAPRPGGTSRCEPA